MGCPNRDETISFLRQFRRAALGPPERLDIWSAIKNVDGLLPFVSSGGTPVGLPIPLMTEEKKGGNHEFLLPTL